jgi:hypothetical protein
MWKGKRLELFWGQDLKQKFEYPLVGVDDFIFGLEVDALDPLAEPHEAFFFRFGTEPDEMSGRVHCEL